MSHPYQALLEEIDSLERGGSQSGGRRSSYDDLLSEIDSLEQGRAPTPAPPARLPGVTVTAPRQPFTSKLASDSFDVPRPRFTSKLGSDSFGDGKPYASRLRSDSWGDTDAPREAWTSKLASDSYGDRDLGDFGNAMVKGLGQGIRSTGQAFSSLGRLIEPDRGSVVLPEARRALSGAWQRMGPAIESAGARVSNTVVTPRVQSMDQIEGIGDAIDYGQQAIGQGLGTSVLSLGTAALTGGGSRVAQIAKSFAPSYLQNFGSVQEELRRQDPEQSTADLDRRAALLTLPVAGIESVADVALVRGMQGGGAVGGSILSRMARGTVAGASREGLTETAQDATSKVGAAVITGQPIDTESLSRELLESGVQGALAGGGMASGGQVYNEMRRASQRRALREKVTTAIQAAQEGVPVAPPEGQVAPAEEVQPVQSGPEQSIGPVSPAEVAPPVTPPSDTEVQPPTVAPPIEPPVTPAEATTPPEVPGVVAPAETPPSATEATRRPEDGPPPSSEQLEAARRLRSEAKVRRLAVQDVLAASQDELEQYARDVESYEDATRRFLYGDENSNTVRSIDTITFSSEASSEAGQRAADARQQLAAMVPVEVEDILFDKGAADWTTAKEARRLAQVARESTPQEMAARTDEDLIRDVGRELVIGRAWEDPEKALILRAAFLELARRGVSPVDAIQRGADEFVQRGEANLRDTAELVAFSLDQFGKAGFFTTQDTPNLPDVPALPPAPVAPPRKPEPLDFAVGIQDAKTGRPIRTTLIRGQGSADSPYNPLSAQVPILGPGRYTTNDRSYAESFGPDVTTHEVSLDNPLVISSDEQWRGLVSRAGWEFPNPFGQAPEKTEAQIKELRRMIEAQGYDGVVIRIPRIGQRVDERTGKTLDKVFGGDQVVEFSGPTPAQAPQDVAPAAPPAEASAPPAPVAETPPEPQPDPLPADIGGVRGAATKIRFFDGEAIDGEYRFVELEDIQTSHDPFGFLPNQRYPAEVQGRDYQRNKDAQDGVTARTMAYDIPTALNPSESINEGAPTLLPNGVTLAGNERAMQLKRLRQVRPQVYADYVRQLAEVAAARHGLDASALEGMKAPALVRVVTSQADITAGPKRWSEINQKSDQTGNKAKSTVESGLARAKKLDSATKALEHFGQTIGEYTVAQYLDTAAGRQFVALLIESNVITSQEYGLLLQDGALGIVGKDAIRQMLLAATVYEQVRLMDAPRSITDKLEHAVPAIVANRGTEWDVGRVLSEALRLVSEAKGKGLQIQEVVDGDLFRSEWTAEVAALATALQEGTKTSIKEQFRKYNQLRLEAEKAAKVHDMFGGAGYHTPPTAFAEVFNADPVDVETSKLFGPPQPSRPKPGQPLGYRDTLASPLTAGSRMVRQVAQSFGQNPQTATNDVVAYTRISEALGKMLGVPINRGRGNLAAMKALGAYWTRRRTIRVGKKAWVDTVAHEVGHHLSRKYGVKRMIKLLPTPRLRGAATRELVAMGRALYGSDVPNGGYAEEGIAEFVSFYVTEPNKIPSIAPTFAAVFEDLMASEPDIRDALNWGRDEYAKQQASTPHKHVQSMIARPQWMMRRMTAEQFARKAVDNLAPIARAVKQALAVSNAPEPLPSQNPVLLFDLAKSAGPAEYALHYGVPDFNTNEPTTESFVNILKVAGEERLEDFTSYLIALRAIELSNRGIESGFDLAKMIDLRDQFAKDEAFNDAARLLYEYQDALLQMRVGAGLMTQRLYDRIKDKNKKRIPFRRFFSDDEPVSMGQRAKGYVADRPGVFTIRGSERPLLHPLAEIVQETYATISVAKRHHAGMTLIRMVAGEPGLNNGLEGGGIIVEWLPQAPRSKQQAQIAKVKEYLEENGIDTSVLDEQELKEALVAWYDKTSAGAKETADKLVPVLHEGELHWVQYNDRAVFDAIQSSDVKMMEILEKLFGAPTRMVRSTSTTYNLDFFLGYNLARDAFTAFTYSQGPTRFPLYHLGRGLLHMARVKDGDKTLERFMREGAPSAGMVGADMRKKLRRLEDLRAEAKRSRRGRLMYYLSHPARTFFTIAEIGENATRLGEFGLVEETLLRKGMAPRDAAIAAASAARELTINFQRHGDVVRKANVLQPFLNANVQGVARFLRESDPRKLTTAKGRARYAQVMLRNTVSLGLPGAALWLLQHDEEGYDEIPEWMKQVGFTILVTGGNTTGAVPFTDSKGVKRHVWVIPTPQLEGVVYRYGIEKFLEFVKTQDPDAIKNLAEAFRKAILPSSIQIALSQPIIENWANKRQFTGGPVVPRSLEKATPIEQVAPGTGETARQLAEWGEDIGFEFSPAKLENVVYGYTTGVGKMLGGFSDLAVRGTRSAMGAPPLRPETQIRRLSSDIPILRRFRKDLNPQNAESVERLYDTYDKNKARYDRWKRLSEARRYEEAQSYYDKYSAEIESMMTDEDTNGRGGGYLRAARRDLDKVTEERRKLDAARMPPAQYRDARAELDQQTLDIARAVRQLRLDDIKAKRQ